MWSTGLLLRYMSSIEISRLNIMSSDVMVVWNMKFVIEYGAQA